MRAEVWVLRFLCAWRFEWWVMNVMIWHLRSEFKIFELRLVPWVIDAQIWVLRSEFKDFWAVIWFISYKCWSWGLRPECLDMEYLHFSIKIRELKFVCWGLNVEILVAVMIWLRLRPNSLVLCKAHLVLWRHISTGTQYCIFFIVLNSQFINI